MIKKNPDEFICLGARLKNCSRVRTLGLKPNFSDYSKEERTLILETDTIYYPTAFYSDLFNTMGKQTFPSHNNYKYAQDKIRQTAIFQMLDIPHPETRVFYGKKQQKKITACFEFPFIAKQARGSSMGKGVFLINDKKELEGYLETCPGPAYIQQYYPIDRDMRIIIIGKEIALAYWRVAQPGEFRTNVHQGGQIRFDPLPMDALDLALNTAKLCGWDDVGIDIIEHNGNFLILEANVKYGRQGFKMAGIDYKKYLENLLINGKI